MPATEDNNPEPVYFLVHVPKCAGTTVHHFLSEGLVHAEYIELRNASKFQRLVTRPHYSTRHGGRDWGRVRAVSGHPLPQSFNKRFGSRPIREAVLLRSPAGHLTSQYNQKFNAPQRAHKAPPPFSAWFRTKPANPISTFLLYRYFELPMHRIVFMSDREKLDFLTDKLSGFWFVGDYRHCDKLLERLSADLGIERNTSNIGVRSSSQKLVDPKTLPDWVRDKIASESAVDVALHERFRDRLWNEDAPDRPIDLSDRSLFERMAREPSRCYHMVAGLTSRRS